MGSRVLKTQKRNVEVCRGTVWWRETDYAFCVKRMERGLTPKGANREDG